MAPRTTYPSLLLAVALILAEPPGAVARTGVPRRHNNNSIRGDPMAEPHNDPECWCTTNTCFRCGIHLLNEQCIKIDAGGYCDEVVLKPALVIGQGEVPASEIGLVHQVPVDAVDSVVLDPICVYQGQDPCHAELFGNPRCPNGNCAQGRCVEGIACAEGRR